MLAIENNIGIFWLYKDTLIYKKQLLSETHEDTIGMHDSPFQHILEWEDNQIYLSKHSELLGTEYQELPRGS
jgi:hypothetical protein